MINCAGAVILSVETLRCLYLLRNRTKRHTWGLVGGKKNSNESIIECLHREFLEEIGQIPNPHKFMALNQFSSSDNNFLYNTYVCLVDSEFIPILNSEHYGYCWVDWNKYPKPLHPGFWNTIKISEIEQKMKSLVHQISKNDVVY